MARNINEEHIIKIVERNPGCTPGHFTKRGMTLINSLIESGRIIPRYHSIIPHYYTSEQIYDIHLSKIIEGLNHENK